MKVFMIGGAGLLGSEAAKELIARGHEVTSIADKTATRVQANIRFAFIILLS